ncbi:MAG: zinc-ribbon domain containing protein [Vicinamibacterales bacterium]
MQKQRYLRAAVIKTCPDCEQPFSLTEGEIAWFADRPWLAEPKRCRRCRSARRQTGRAGSVRVHGTSTSRG